MLTLLTILLAPAQAQDAVSAPVAITVDAKTTEFIPLRSGNTLEFITPGPKKILVTSRRRMAGAAQRAKTAAIEARGDGNPIMTIKVPGTAIADGRIDDRLGGFPSRQDRSVITVPDGGQRLTLTAPPGGPDFFIRVTDKDKDDALILPVGAAAVAEATPQPKQQANEAPRSGESEPARKEKSQAKAAPAEKRPEGPTSLQPAAGVEMGFGIPARGTAMVFHIGAKGRYPVYKSLISAGGSIGWHQINVREDVDVVNPISGDLDYQADWSTSIVPIQARATVHVPYSVGSVVPIASAGLGMFILTRSDGGTSTTSVAVGPELAAGCEIDINAGLLQTTISWSEARAQLGNQGVDGAAVAETFAVTSFNIAYLYAF